MAIGFMSEQQSTTVMGPNNPLGRTDGPSEYIHTCTDACRVTCDHCTTDLCSLASDFDDTALVLKIPQPNAPYLALCTPCHNALIIIPQETL
jgi:hypothetical protein